MNNVDEYQDFTDLTAVYPASGEIGGLMYATLGLNGEAGEVAEKVKKIIRDSDGVITPEHSVTLAKELGDVMWYLTRIATELGYSMSDILKGNVSKLSSRQERDTLHGSGDNR